jgi:uncharacterized protein YbjT (DUF2867 family)
MKVVVVGGTGAVGGGLVALLRERGYDVVAASPSTGVDAVSGAGLAKAVKGAGVVVDVTNSPVYEEEGATAFFVSSTVNQLAAERAAGVAHHIVLSIVGIDRDGHDMGYYRAKMAQEQAVRDGGVPFTIVRATQFTEFVRALVEGSIVDGRARLPRTRVQPVALADLVPMMAAVVSEEPANGILEVAGPEALSIDDAARIMLDDVEVVTDPQAPIFLGTTVAETVLLPGPGARLGTTGLR